MTQQFLSMYVLYFMMIWGFSPSMMAERFGSQCGQLEHQFFSAENMALKKFVYKNKTVPNHVICGRDCGLEKDCRSFNFYKCRGFCEFSNATRKEHTEDFVEDQESLYFDMDENTTLLSKNDTTLECFRSCEEGIKKSGFYTICPWGLVNCQQIYCEMETSSVKESPTDHSSTEPTTHHIKTQPPTNYSSTVPTSHHYKTQPPTNHSSTVPTSHHIKTQPPTNYSSTVATTHHIKTQPPIPTSHSSPEPRTQHLTSDPTTPFVSTTTPLPKLSSCKEFFDAGYKESKVYTIYPSGPSAGLRVYCDMETDGGGWIVFQRRIDGTVDFYRNWAEYQTGFGDPSGEFWLGNDNLVQLTSAGYTDLWVDLESDGTTGYVEYEGVHVTGSEYELSYYKYIDGNADDSLGDYNGFRFTTKDRDNDDGSDNCAETTHGAWWFKDCAVTSLRSHLNGEYEENLGDKRGIIWCRWTQPITSCSMKLRQP